MTAAFETPPLVPPAPAPAAEALVEVEDLGVAFHERSTRSLRTVVTGVSFTLWPGRIVALIGESGSGKSVTARTLVGLNGKGAVTTARRFVIQGKPVLGNGERAWRRLRGREIGLVLQDALTSLDPLRTIAREVAEPLVAHGWGTGRQRDARVIEALGNAGLADPGQFLSRRAGELSGGQRQRALIAQATVLDPPILIADEPTTALDSTIQDQILALFETLRDRGHAILLITHDLGVVSRLADEVLVLRNGHIVESGPTAHVLRQPAHEYTRTLLRAIPDPSRKRARLLSEPAAPVSARTSVTEPETGAPQGPAIEVSRLVKSYVTENGRRINALDNVSLTARHGETLGVVGESGSGKSTLSWILAGLIKPDSGTVKVLGRSREEVSGTEAFRHRRSIQVVYQDPLGSFDPRHSVGQILVDALVPDRTIDPRQHEDIAVQALASVSLSTDLWHRNPLTLSGGQRQRISIARALVTGARLLVLDEPVSALDATIQASILDLLKDLQERHGLTYVFVSHDLGVVHHVSHQVIVLRAGAIIERGSADEIYFAPRTEYARALVAAVPRIGHFLGGTGDIRSHSSG